MMKPTRLHLVVGALLATLGYSHVQAAAFNLNEHSASGLGRAFAGEAAIADNASVLARNPAAMSRFTSTAISFAGTYVRPNIDLKGRDNLSVGSLTLPKSYLDADNIAPSAVIPAGYLIQPLNDKWAFGLALFTNYGLATEFDKSYAGGMLGGDTDLTTMNINPNISWRLNNQWSFGAGLNAIYADAKLVRRAGALSYVNTALSSTTEMANLSGKTWGFGWNVGALYELNANNRFGLAYRSQSTLSFDGDFSGYSSGFNKVNGKLDLELPAIAEFSGYHKLNQSFAVHYSVQWTDWSVFKTLKATGSGCSGGVCFQKDQEFSDSWRYAIGGTWYANDAWTLRAGLALDKQAAHNVISIPDTERMWYTLGASYQLTRQLGLDAGVAYLQGKDVNIDEPLTIPGMGSVTVPYTSTASAWLFSTQLNYTF